MLAPTRPVRIVGGTRRLMEGDVSGSACNPRGVGYLILQAEGTFDVNPVFAGIAVLAAVALVLDDAVSRIERSLMKWQPRQGETEKL